ncbi:dihydroxyacetone kinase phosphotransfer subunit [Bradyrhizobium sp. i1.3.1]
MSLDRTSRENLVRALAESVIQHADELTSLDQAIGDGDHGLNMKRGFEAVLATLPGLADKSLPEMLKSIGMTLVMKGWRSFWAAGWHLLHGVGQGASRAANTRGVCRGYGYGNQCRKGARTLGGRTENLAGCPGARASGIGCRRRCAGDCVRSGAGGRSHDADARYSRQGFFSRRTLHWSHGPRFALNVPVDRGCSQSIGIRGKVMNNPNGGNVGIVIVSHSPKIAEGAADMVRQMVGNAVPLAWTGGDVDGGLGTNVAGILEAIEAAWSAAGVAVLVDLGGAETNSEMAVEMLAEDRRARVVVCNAPVVEGAVIAATESSGGSSLAAVKRSAEEFYA